ncbi:cytochrome p450 [Coprinopsis cinerea AmutBmut pab1-1]|nr:cytochrome p450 [Coprinopsis cinerea AmutBmut pab1-1]
MAPPGVLFVAERAPSIVLPPLLAYGALHALQRFDLVSLPTWAVVTFITLAKPLHYIVSVHCQRLRNWNEARKRAARLAPRVEEAWYSIGGLSLISQMGESFVNGYFFDIMQSWAQKYGYTYEVPFLSEVQMWTMEPEHVKAMLATQFQNFEKGPSFRKIMHSFLGTGVFNSDGEMWKFHRGITRPFFSRDRISDFDIFDAHATDALERGKARLAEGHPIDFQDLVARFTLDSAAKFLFGAELGSLSAGVPYPPNSGLPNPTSFTLHPSNTFVNAFFNGLNEVAMRSVIGEEWPLREFSKDLVKPYRDIVDQIIEPMVDAALQAAHSDTSEKEKSGRDEPTTLLQQLVSQTKDKSIIMDELLNLFVAGRDTTACTLTFSVYMLAEHPAVVERLRADVLNKVGEKGRPSYDDIRDMKYLRAFINEVLRLYPPVPINNRQAINDTLFTTKDGAQPIFVPAKTQVIYSVVDIQRRKDLWGPDADEFDPDRFLDERLHRYLIPNPFIFSPFNAGPRICLGQQFAYNEVSFFLIRLLQQFSKFSLALDAQPADSLPPAAWKGKEGLQAKEKIWPGVNLTLFVKGGLWVRME